MCILAGAGRPAVAAEPIEPLELLRAMQPPSAAYTEAVQRGDVPTAARELARYFTSRKGPGLPAALFVHAGDETHHKPLYLSDRPDRVLKHQFAFLAEYVEIAADIDWNGRYGRGDSEITWWINRFLFLDCLLAEFERSGRREYPRYGVKLMLDWIHKNPLDQAEKAWGAWRTLEIGLRLSSWAVFVSEAAARRLIEPDELVTILGSIREQVNYLAAHSGTDRRNWGFMEQCGIATIALVFPELRDAKRWLQGVLDVYLKDVEHQIYPDGSQEEMSPHYAYTVAWSLARVIHLMNEQKEPVPLELRGALKRGATYLALITKPDGTLPMMNDGDAIDIRHFLAFVAEMLDAPAVRFLVAEKRDPRDAPALCRMFAYSGVVMMRDSWDAQARCLLMDAGPYGTAHQHEDALAIDVSAFGRSFIVDPGRYSYAGGPMMDYFRGTRSHATVMVDGAGQQRASRQDTWRAGKPLFDRFVADDRLALAIGEYTAGYADSRAAGVIHRREVLFVDRRYWVVSDVLLGEGRHRIEQNFQFTPGELKVQNGMAVTGHADVNLATAWHWPVEPQARIRIGEKDPPAGWYSPCYWKAEPAPHLTLSAELDLPARLTFVLWPFEGSEGPEVTIEPDESAKPAGRIDTGVFRITRGDTRHTVLIRDPRARGRIALDSTHTTTAPAAVISAHGLHELLAAASTTTTTSP